MYKFIKVRQVGAVEVITLNRPEVMNAWHMPMRNELLKALGAARKSREVGAIVLTGTGKDAFCAGQDLDEARKFDPARAKLWVEEWRILYEAVRRLDIPVVCALNGLAAGSAFQVALLTDYRIGHDKITMGQPEINSGIVSALGFWILREIVGLSRAIELILTGRMLSADGMRALRAPAPDRAGRRSAVVRHRHGEKTRRQTAGRDAAQQAVDARSDAAGLRQGVRSRDGAPSHQFLEP